MTARGKGLGEAGLLRGLSFQVRVCACFPPLHGVMVIAPRPRSFGDGRQEQRTRQWHTTESGDVILRQGSVFQARPWAWERESVRLCVS